MAVQWLGYIESLNSFSIDGISYSFNQPHDISGDSNFLYVLDTGNNCVRLFENISPFRYGGAWPSFNTPKGIEIDENYVYVADTGNNRIQIWSKKSHSQRIIFGSNGTSNVRFNAPEKIAVDNNYIYVSDSGNNRLQVFSKNNINGILSFDDPNPDNVTVLTDNQLSTTFVTSISGNGFNTIKGVDIDTNFIYMVDSKVNNTGHNKIQICFNKPTTFSYVGQFGSYGSESGKFNNPSGIYINGNNLYVLNSENHRLDVFNKNTYNFITSLGSLGSGTSQFYSPFGLHIDNTTNKIYIADTLNNRIQIFNNIGNSSSIIEEEPITIDLPTYLRLKEPEMFSDIDIKLRKISGYRDVNKSLNEAAINQSLYSLLNTQKGERVFNLNYGCNLRSYLFEPMDEFTAKNILEDIKLAIAIWEPRVKIIELNIDINYDESAYFIVLEYEILNSKKTGTFELILQKI